MLYNRSTPGNIEFAPVEGVRDPDGAQVQADRRGLVQGHGRRLRPTSTTTACYDMFVSNITTSFGIEESNFQFMNTAKEPGRPAQRSCRPARRRGRTAAPTLGTAWSGWGWDIKMADFNNSGELAIAQATGFVKGEVNRWPQLQELATANDRAAGATRYWWPNVVKR